MILRERDSALVPEAGAESAAASGDRTGCAQRSVSGTIKNQHWLSVAEFVAVYTAPALFAFATAAVAVNTRTRKIFFK